MHAIDSSAVAGGFVDYRGVRYYTCCGDCLAQLKPDPSKFVANSEKYIRDLKATPDAEK
jgi:hypothetical protein